MMVKLFIDSFRSLEMGASVTVSLSNAVLVTTNTYYYFAWVDALSNELDRADNCSSAALVRVVSFGTYLPSLDFLNSIFTNAGNNNPHRSVSRMDNACHTAPPPTRLDHIHPMSPALPFAPMLENRDPKLRF